MDHDELQTRFTYHPPKDDQPLKYENLRSHGLHLAEHLDNLCPDSREKSLAITKLEECIFWANAAIARRDE